MPGLICSRLICGVKFATEGYGLDGLVLEWLKPEAAGFSLRSFVRLYHQTKEIQAHQNCGFSMGISFWPTEIAQDSSLMPVSSFGDRASGWSLLKFLLTWLVFIESSLVLFRQKTCQESLYVANYYK